MTATTITPSEISIVLPSTSPLSLLATRKKAASSEPRRQSESHSQRRHAKVRVQETRRKHDHDARDGQDQRGDHDRLGALPEQPGSDQRDVDGRHVREEDGQRHVELAQREHEGVELQRVEDTEDDQAAQDARLPALPQPAPAAAEREHDGGGERHPEGEHGLAGGSVMPTQTPVAPNMTAVLPTMGTL